MLLIPAEDHKLNIFVEYFSGDVLSLIIIFHLIIFEITIEKKLD